MPETTTKSNVVEYGLSNCYAAVAKYDASTKKYTYETPFAMPYAKSISFDPQGNKKKIFADNIAAKTLISNTGYSGTLSLLQIPKEFRVKILGEIEKNGALLENSDAKTVEFALIFQFEGDVTNKRHVLYRCTATRPQIASDTKEEEITENTLQISIEATPRENDHYTKLSLLESDNAAAYAKLITEVVEPEAIEPAA